jgi:hypothetical protein
MDDSVVKAIHVPAKGMDLMVVMVILISYIRSLAMDIIHHGLPVLLEYKRPARSTCWENQIIAPRL